MKKIVLLSAVLGTLLFAHEGHHFDPKAGEHLVIPVNELSEKGDKSVGEVFLQDFMAFTFIKMLIVARLKKVLV